MDDLQEHLPADQLVVCHFHGFITVCNLRTAGLSRCWLARQLEFTLSVVHSRTL